MRKWQHKCELVDFFLINLSNSMYCLLWCSPRLNLRPDFICIVYASTCHFFFLENKNTNFTWTKSSYTWPLVYFKRMSHFLQLKERCPNKNLFHIKAKINNFSVVDIWWPSHSLLLLQGNSKLETQSVSRFWTMVGRNRDVLQIDSKTTKNPKVKTMDHSCQTFPVYCHI